MACDYETVDPPPIDANTVRQAWKTLTPEEKHHFIALLIKRLKLSVWQGGRLDNVIEALQRAFNTEDETLAEIYCEVKGIPE
jgi:putative heme degradation protein